MMNKALEIIEARWCLTCGRKQIEVVVHPQSVVHSLVEFVDALSGGSIESAPDMKLPIQYALTYPERWPSPAERLDLTKNFRWEFEPPDHDKFPALELGLECARAGGTTGAVLKRRERGGGGRIFARRIEV